MQTHDDRYYAALKSRDSRFDGRFFVGVTSTGVYCRPICPARTPKRENTRFYTCAAAAETAGFRPCRRCRPDTAPGTPAWAGTSTTVARALRLIAEGALDEGGVDHLADRLGVGSRHLRRLFDRHLGASPLAVAQTRRVHFARKLLDQTDLPMREIAFASGFSSVRRFNSVLRDTFGWPPSELRPRVRAAGGVASGANADGVTGTVTLRLPFREPFDWDALLAYLAARAIPGVEQVEDGVYRRTVRGDDAPGLVSVRRCSDKPCVVLEVSSSVRRRLMDTAERVRRVFDLGSDPVLVAERLGRDPLLKRSVRRRPGLRVPGAWDPFEIAVRAILGQQVSVKGATTLAGRLVAKFGERVPDAAPSAPDHLFPTADALAEADVASIGMPETRGEAVRALARAVRDGAIPLHWGADAEDAHTALVALPGVGDWTADYIAMRALGEPDSFPAGDLGVRKAMANGHDRLPPVREVLARAEAWRPWRAYAVLHLWMSAGDAPPRKRKKETKR
jgi:AraC family transcriptional regulator, regulatory protein of adaptative response / DNA-3-methyladenine glycosylase II